jgi:hypothetical protein
MLLGGNTEDVLQLLVHLADHVCRGHGQSIQKCCGYGYVLAGPGNSGGGVPLGLMATVIALALDQALV